MKQIRQRLTYANVVSTLALVLVVGGATAIAARRPEAQRRPAAAEVERGDHAEDQGQAVTTRKIKKNAITSAKIKDKAVKSEKLDDDAVDDREDRQQRGDGRQDRRGDDALRPNRAGGARQLHQSASQRAP